MKKNKLTTSQQGELAYNPNEIIAALSHERLHPYLLFTATKSEEASLIPYDLVQRLSSRLFLPLQYLEVTLRNRVYEVLKEHYRWRRKKYKELSEPEDWLLWMPQKKSLRTKINDACNYASKNVKGRAMGVGDIISGLSFGAWIDILKEYPSQKSHYHFWLFTQNKIFPNAKGETRETICAELVEIKKIRNRLFHYEPIWNFDGITNCHMGLLEILSKYERIMQAIHWISEDMHAFLDEGGQQYLLSEQTRILSDTLLKSFKEGSMKNNH